MTANTWQHKAQRIIAELCSESYKQANYRDGRKLKGSHRPYSVPQDAELLVQCLRTNDEETAKAVFIRHAYGFVNR